jgi:hypothetical protein
MGSLVNNPEQVNEAAVAIANTDSVPVAPDAVRVFRGFRRDDLGHDDFVGKLGSIFIPGTVQIQAPVGLTAYMPSVLPRDKAAAAPDEIALVFYEYQDAYDEAKETVGGRAYSDLHGLVFDLDRSLSGFPVRFEGTLEPDGRYHLFDTHVDWQHGVVNAFVGVRSGCDAQAFLNRIAAWATGVRDGADGVPDGAIVVASEDYVVYWEHWPDAAAAERSQIQVLAGIVEPVYHTAIAPYQLGEGLWDPYDGVKVTGGETFNFQFKRRPASSS